MRKTFQSEVCKYFQGRPSYEENDTCYVTEISWGNPMKSLRNNAIAIQCESKKSPLRFSDIFSQTVGNF